jgi:hypothetical protein
MESNSTSQRVPFGGVGAVSRCGSGSDYVFTVTKIKQIHIYRTDPVFMFDIRFV